VISQGRPEFDLGVEQRLVRSGELPLEILGPLRSVDIIAQENGEAERELRMGLDHHRRQLVGRLIAGADIPDHRKADRVLPLGQGDLLGSEILPRC
jgi:hypothetical protein